MTRTEDVSADLARAKLLADTHRSGGDMRLAGTIPGVIAEAWATECGASIGTQEFAAYVQRKLMSGEFSRFVVKGF